MPVQVGSRALPFAAEFPLMGDGIHRLLAPDAKGRRLREFATAETDEPGAGGRSGKAGGESF